MVFHNNNFNIGCFFVYTECVLKYLLSLVVIIAACRAPAAADYISYLASTEPWKSYVPKNFELVKKLGDSAFFWSMEAPPEEFPEAKVLSRIPYLTFKPNVVLDAERKTTNNILIYRTRYTIDSKSRRLVQKRDDFANKNLIMLGCSFTFGTGLGDEETFPFYLSNYRKNYNIFNLGIDGAGANDVLDDLRSFKRFEDISKKGGLVVYTAISDHIQRSICNMNCYGRGYRDWVLKKSNYQYDRDNQMLVNRGTFEESRPITGMIFNILAKIGLIDSVNFPLSVSDDQLELYVLMVEDMKKISKEKLNSDFYFVFYPGHYEEWARLKPLLKKYGIKYLDLSKIDFKTASNKRHSIILDGHPTNLSQYLYASLLHYQLPR